MRVLVDDDIDGYDIAETVALLPEWRWKRALAYRLERDTRACISSYLLLQRALREICDIDEAITFGYGVNGKPYIIGHEDIHFNISHCRVAVACAVGEQPVGIDIETLRPFREALASRVLSESEMENVMKASNRAEAFITLWTRKESFVKMTGEGLRTDLRSLDLSNATFETRKTKDYIVTVCTQSLPSPLQW